MKDPDFYGFTSDYPYQVLFDEAGYVIGYYDGVLAILDAGSCELETSAWISNEAAPGMLVTPLAAVMRFPSTGWDVEKWLAGCSFNLVERGVEVVTVEALKAAFRAE